MLAWGLGALAFLAQDEGGWLSPLTLPQFPYLGARIRTALCPRAGKRTYTNMDEILRIGPGREQVSPEGSRRPLCILIAQLCPRRSRAVPSGVVGPSTASTEGVVGVTQAHHGLPPGSPEPGEAVPANSAAPLTRGAGSLCQERGFLGPG